MATKKPSAAGPLSQDDKVAAILEQTAAIQEDLAKLTKKVSRYILMARISAVIWLILIIGPIIAGIIFLPPLIKDMVAPYQELLPANSGALNIFLRDLNK
jgi:hypothetical protein